MDALEIRNLHAYYGKAHILQGITLCVPEGHVSGLFGRNGAGKTTLFKSIMNLGPRTEGEILFFGRPLGDSTCDERARAGLSFMQQDVRAFMELTVLENIQVAANAIKSPRSLDAILELLPELEVLLPRQAGQLSGGQQQLVAFGRSLAMNCRILLVDEPSEGLMPQLVNRIGEIVCLLAAQGVTVFLVEQNLSLGLAVCSHVSVIEKGVIKATGAPQKMLDENVFHKFLGV